MLKVTNTTKDTNLSINGLIQDQTVSIAPGGVESFQETQLSPGYHSILELFKDHVLVETVDEEALAKAEAAAAVEAKKKADKAAKAAEAAALAAAEEQRKADEAAAKAKAEEQTKEEK